YVGCGGCLLLLPGVAAVGRDQHRQWSGRKPLAAELPKADVDVPEERTGRSVIRPDLLLVSEGRAALALRSDNGMLPLVLASDNCRSQGGLTVDSRDRDRLEAFERLQLAVNEEVGGQISNIETGTVRPREAPVSAWLRPERKCGITPRDEAFFEVPGERADWPCGFRCAGVS